eukprot:GHVQ01036273.1.p1 GENE.GHVQ01036273.1~~GHVQ01036273.1.p1  ORF type:complete len:826 (-),score=72.14 GHVQ01036273.1:4421-6898(-)
MATKEEESLEARNEEPRDELAIRMDAFMDGKYMAIFMGLLTVFALCGEDIRVAFFEKSADPVFFVLFSICLALFGAEIIVFCIVKEGYKWGFFFWLDVLATISLVADIQWLINWLAPVRQYGVGNTFDDLSTFQTSDTSTGGSSVLEAGKVVRLVRLIRLIRVIKLYKIITERNESDEEERLKEQAREALNAKQAALKRIEASRLGKQLSDKITRLVIVGVLMILLGLPQKSVMQDHSRYFGLKTLFWLGRNDCSVAHSNAVAPCIVETSGAAWNWTILRFSEVAPGDKKSSLLWLHVPDFFHAGQLKDIKEASLWNAMEGQFQSWEQDESCAGLKNPECPWRDDEIDVISYEYDSVTAFAKFQVRGKRQMEAYMGIATTVFVIIVLGTLISVFSSDTQRLVIAPIEKMVNIVKQLADDPLRKPKVVAGVDNDEQQGGRKKKVPQLETSVLETTILKIGGLLQVGFGEVGAEVIGNNMSSGDGELNIMIPGKKVQAIFGFCDIKRSSDASECLQEDVTVFINLISRITHFCCNRWNGAASKNSGDGFLFVWKFSNAADNAKYKDRHQALRSAEVANKALVAFIKSIAEIRRHAGLIEFEQDGRVVSRFGDGYKVQAGFALHVGWAIEGAIGSHYKIDASYLSPHVKFTEKLQTTTKFYQTPLLMSEPFYVMLSVKAKERIRKIDVVKPRIAFHDFTGIFAFDVNDVVTESPKDVDHQLGDIIKPQDIVELPLEHLSGAGVEYMFVTDADISGLQEGIPEKLFSTFRGALGLYLEGKWKEALELFYSCLEMRPGDGPSRSLIDFIESLDDPVAPEDWQGCRTIPTL